MPANMIKSFSEKTGKSVSEIESKWDRAKDAVKKQYPDVKEGDSKFYQLTVSILKKMIGMKNEDAEPQGDTNTVTMGGEDAIYKKRMSGKKKVWDRMDNAIKEKKLKEGTIWEKLSIKLDELNEIKKVLVKNLKPGMVVVNEIGNKKRIISNPQPTHKGYFRVATDKKDKSGESNDIIMHGDSTVNVLEGLYELEDEFVLESVKPPSKTDAKNILNIVKSYLYAERNNQVMLAQKYHDQLEKIGEKYGMDVSDVIRQGKEHLKKHSVAAIMNSIV